MKNTVSEVKITLEGINRLDKDMDQISDLDDKVEENT